MKTVLLPVKEFANAKQRLCSRLEPRARAGLARAMCLDVLKTLARTRVPNRVVVFTAADEVIRMARPFVVDVVLEKVVDGHSAAVNHMVSELLSSSSRILSIASDLPRLVPSEIDFVLDAATEPITLIPSRDWTGTNGALFISPARIVMEYGEGSFLRHLSKAVSKAEGRISRLGDVVPSAYSVSIARRVSKDPRLVEIILRESRRIVRLRGEVLICETHHGFICANAGVDESNVEGEESVTLLPKDPDRSARILARELGCGVIITDTFGRVWRDGLLDAAIGIGRVPALLDFRRQTDPYGHRLRVTLLAAADALSAAAGLAMGQTAGTPAALIRGFDWEATDDTSAAAMLRPAERDLFL